MKTLGEILSQIETLPVDKDIVRDFSNYFDFVPPKKSDRIIKSITTNGNVYTVFIKHYKPFELLFQKILKELGILHTSCAIIKIRGEKYLMQLYSKEIPFTDIYSHFLMSITTLSQKSIMTIRKILAIQWISCLTEISDSKIYIKDKTEDINPYIYDVGDFHESILYTPKNFSKMIKKWFGDNENSFYDFVKEILREYGVNNLKRKVLDIVSEFSDKNITSSWYNAFCLRIVCEKLGTRYD